MKKYAILVSECHINKSDANNGGVNIGVSHCPGLICVCDSRETAEIKVADCAMYVLGQKEGLKLEKTDNGYFLSTDGMLLSSRLLIKEFEED